MKKITLCICLLYTALYGNAQEVKLEDLKTPNSPAFQLLDISPSNIERPTNPKALAVNIASLTNNGTAVPKNFAFEVSPYWYTKRENASIFQYLNIARDGKQNSLTGLYNKLSVSAASSFSDSTAGSLLKNTNYVSLGGRTNLLALRSKDQNSRLTAAINFISKKLTDLTTKNEKLKDPLFGVFMKNRSSITEVTKRISDNTQKLANESDEVKKAALNAELTKDNAELKSLNDQKIALEAVISKMDNQSANDIEKDTKADKELQRNIKMLEETPWLQVDLAAAYSIALPGNAFSNQRVNRYGAWLNLTLARSLSDKDKTDHILSVTGSVRFMHDNILADTTKNIFVGKGCLDIGVRFEYSLKDFSLSFEYLKRSYNNTNGLGSERSIGVIQYRLSDSIYLTGSFGKNFGQIKNAFTLFGINWGFGKTAMSKEGLQ